MPDADVSATVLYPVGAAAATSIFETIYTYILQQDWVLTAQAAMPAVASTVMISPTATIDQSPSQWVGAAWQRRTMVRRRSAGPSSGLDVGAIVPEPRPEESAICRRGAHSDVSAPIDADVFVSV